MEVTTRPNDSIRFYSELFDVPLVLIEQSNTEINLNQLTIGQTVQIPGYMGRPYQITGSDTLWHIAIEQNVPFDMLQLANPSIEPDNMQIGQQIVIPERVNNLIISDLDHYTFDQMVRDIDRLRTVFPFIVQQAIGSSVMGKDIIELRVGTGDKQVHVNGSFHANEWITTSVMMRFINEYARSLTNKKPIRDVNAHSCFLETTLSIVPMVNPDGVNLVLDGASAAGPYQDNVLALNDQNPDFSNWKANIAGVDLNKQYPAFWEVEAARKPDSPEPRDYPGPYPLSEPEAIAMADLTKKRNFRRVHALHTQGEEIYWGFNGMEPSVARDIVNIYSCVSNYRSVQHLDNYAGYKDWFIQEFRRPGYTVELGTGINPLPFGQFEEIYQETLGIMLANLYLQK
ncbi:gamma-D-glutamyl-{L}-meso-diaminopimelate peptidase I . Metallo peptidase. MEROPS family M14C [Lentibacillus halodurans]|uniref:Gamma-D-glutamyl-(L)-meso-diaminopimelate peptidase I. Metallo peptidase. MEROPS family M14C n=1 Tax=Lentibacillus halodurans TaxID=237679 RepID=A0A1I0VFX2_9BACI|nr:M14 family metallopeptidase [Lentibacillus halodurans]SFA74870.1 gamma-D-glutamyl-{L}-meso-diaminopimelate peptidase I . Metallo peptidase. MEROPS family M14C [Lentibacillus halodurans]